MAERTKLSCYIRTQNEEERLGKVLEAAGAVADEIVVVDSGSTDRTVEIAEAAGARVLHNPWPGNGRQKRVGEDACRNDWLLDLDADEVLSPELQKEIRELMSDGAPRHPVYQARLVYAPPVGAPWQFNYRKVLKLYDRRVVRVPDHPAWDQIELPPDVAPGRLDGAIYHYHMTDFAQLVDKQNRTSSGRARNARLKSLPAVTFRLFFAFPYYFFKSYVLRRLYLGGRYGFAVAVILAFGRWLRDVKMMEVHMTRRRDEKAGGQGV